AGREALVLGVVRTLDVDRVGRAGPGAQLAADALLEPVRVAVEDVAPVVARRGRPLLLGIELGGDLLEHRPEGQAEALDAVEHLLALRFVAGRRCAGWGGGRPVRAGT